MLIIEDGTGKVDSNSYVSVDELKAFATVRGLALPSDDMLEAGLISATDYLEIEECYKGKKTSSLQSLKWPRTGAYIDGDSFPTNSIPKALKIAQIRLALEVFKGIDLMPTISGSNEDYVIEETVGPITTKYADATDFSGTPTFTAVNGLLLPLIGRSCGGSGLLNVFRA